MPILRSNPEEFEIHPAGPSEGIIYDLEDVGKEKLGDLPPTHNVVWKIESITYQRDNGRPHTLWHRTTLSGHKQSNMRKMAVEIVGRELTEEEAWNFDTDLVVGVRVWYTVIHATSRAGRSYAKLQSIGRLQDQSKGELHHTPEKVAQQKEYRQERENTDGREVRIGEGADELPY